MRFPSPWRLRAIVCLLALLPVGAAIGSPEDDYKTAREAYYARGDIMAAMPLLKRAGDAGHAGAQSLYAFLLDQSDDDEVAVKYYRMAVDQGYPEAMFGLAKMYAGGEGVKADQVEAKRLYEQAADHGVEQAYYVLALAYMNGGLGLTDAQRAAPEALKWIRGAADRNHVKSLERLVQVYTVGEFGAAPDPVEVTRVKERLAALLPADPNAAKKRRRR